MRRTRFASHLKSIAGIALGSAIFAFGLNAFTISNGLAEGGLTGIALMFNYLFGIPPGWFLLAANGPLLILGWRTLGGRAMIMTVVGTVLSSVFIEALAFLRTTPMDDTLLAALYAGAAIGTGLGLIFRFGGTTGGVDIVARVVNKYRGTSMGRTMFMIDAGVIALSMLTYLDTERAMYTIVSLTVAARVIDFVQETAYSARMVLIVSDRIDAIAHRILHELGRGATIIQSRGAYTNAERPMLYCVVARNEVVHLKAIIMAEDPTAFVVISDAHDVHGEGFTLDEEKRPIR
ncbi:MAG: YitT family protein [Hydrogenibacillus schlegelii]|uniref:YitT family protein n=1 Tax=Hydrogenibacillus schlegelii TaxID=1484 RepID=A0A947CY48_HYDSH|nr:YitT family protein [Hydrogenibacillus schlegelii]